MKMLRTVLFALCAVALVTSAYAAGMKGGDAMMGKKYFDDPMFSGGAISCMSCHPDGKGLEKSGEKGKMVWTNPAGMWLSLEDAVNVCIVMANKGKAIDPKGKEMMDIVAYIKSLSKMPMKKDMMKEKSGY